ncbi:MAG: FAD-dependent pyridine nucleotide-disulfide oxidoreductase [Candidatus Nomurabacteria bacterium GW2011_GWA2_41_25]|uniref:NADH:ubiquinone reductase (non-electrogenic) n=2 Tax=Candidatus Nomuraibacteriota TaxID=1752729 RepID=A0A1F6YBR4_9BACT|nr:MAG: FAD-dependent pyridine nucleotide-disulfide oxidoreductase [Candidatus Nomurabacteria bacterium GW2011_GWA2_41_25]OGI67536.1 MAG: hypothetical protein A2823_00265 [Candidatus Nomurabacteria bacterium RIFCSPHIGHO2_01_FULL_41_91]OGI81004.1 MAG: hypothetical protein A3D43_03010 [Candidatus Nomurabacteria bacterium RIFCSPHIGHO2_02_FULL_41_52]OGI85176.1 MAG: hypothetical protein A3F49_03155 [Candidatus Nomurabacteria bacterium RIFCSPHIGHO2_12_FULL_42_19]OGI94226.1 MAG: hypothetical protein A
MSRPIKILIIGNGFGGVYALKNLHKFFHNDKKIELALVGEKNYFLFTPLLHEVATGGINPGNIIEPIRKVLGCCLDKFYLGKAEIINFDSHTVQVENALISYDYLVLAPGAETNFYNIPGAEEYSFPLKSIADAIKIKNRCIMVMERASHVENRIKRKNMLRFVVVGGGPTGVELAAELEELIKETFSSYYPEEIMEDTSIVLIQKSPELVPAFGEKIRKKSLEILRKKGIEVMLTRTVKEVGLSYVVINENIKIFTETVIWVAGVKPAELKFNQPAKQSSDGRLVVNEYLQLENHKEVFAIGDAAAFRDANKNIFLPALAQVAEKEAKAVAKNIQLLINNKIPEKFLYRNSGNLMSLGQWMAVGEIFNFTFSGHTTWWFWRTVYLFKLISWRKKVRVAADWTMNLFSPRDISQL